MADAELDRRMDARAVEAQGGAPDALDLHRGDPYLARGDLLAARRDRPEVPRHLAARDQGEPSAPEPLDGVDAHRTSRSRPGSVARAELDTAERRSEAAARTRLSRADASARPRGRRARARAVRRGPRGGGSLPAARRAGDRPARPRPSQRGATRRGAGSRCAAGP